jgi:hypothetical protein
MDSEVIFSGRVSFTTSSAASVVDDRWAISRNGFVFIQRPVLKPLTKDDRFGSVFDAVAQ